MKSECLDYFSLLKINFTTHKSHTVKILFLKCIEMSMEKVQYAHGA